MLLRYTRRQQYQRPQRAAYQNAKPRLTGRTVREGLVQVRQLVCHRLIGPRSDPLRQDSVDLHRGVKHRPPRHRPGARASVPRARQINRPGQPRQREDHRQRRSQRRGNEPPQRSANPRQRQTPPRQNQRAHDELRPPRPHLLLDRQPMHQKRQTNPSPHRHSLPPTRFARHQWGQQKPHQHRRAQVRPDRRPRIKMAANGRQRRQQQRKRHHQGNAS